MGRFLGGVRGGGGLGGRGGHWGARGEPGPGRAPLQSSWSAGEGQQRKEAPTAITCTATPSPPWGR